VTDFSIEKKYSSPVIGLDEVGRGPIAGPVVSCGCLFKSYKNENEYKELIIDSKKLSLKKRKKAFSFLISLKKQKIINFYLAMASVEEIDKLNILEATKLSMNRVVDKFKIKKSTLIIDGNFQLKYKNYKEQSLVKGDQKSISIAAASIIAKVHRDRLMGILSRKFKGYCWEDNAGYGTKKHIEELKRKGITKYHRRSFEPIKSMFN
tara:strand:- start:41413 stop:42033 length:621 start_codon:yes stop_codon:yes gene_type:complete